MNDTLKVAGRIGAELGAAKAENEKLRQALKRIIDRCEAFVDDEAEMRTPSVEVLMGIAEDAIYTVHLADAALSQQAEPCGGCGNSDESKRCIGCGHRFEKQAEPVCQTMQRPKAECGCPDCGSSLIDWPTAEPTDTYTAVDMATAAAQGFRDGQAAVEQAVAQDERDAFYAGLYKKSAPMWHRLHELAVSKGYDHVQFAIECAPVYRCDCMGARKVAIDMAGNTIPCECVAADNETEPAPAQDELPAGGVTIEKDIFGTVHIKMGDFDYIQIQYQYPYTDNASQNVLAKRIAELLTRPAQTEQQPIRMPERKRTEHLPKEYKTMTVVRAGLEAYNRALDDVAALNAAPIAQTAPQGKFRMGDLVKKSTGSEWEGRVVGTYSTEQTKEGYAVESSAHRNSVQIYPAKALEAVE